MSMLVAAIIFVLLLAVAIAHFVWSIGASWPIRDKAMLAQTVIGRPGVTRVPRLMSLAIAILVLAAGTIGLALADKTSGGLWLTLAGGVLAAIFLARGAVGYTSGWRAQFSEEPFATLDRRNYSPLSLFIGAGFLLLVAMRLL
jgi:hypothetical protein